jgi:multidrug efflux pump
MALTVTAAGAAVRPDAGADADDLDSSAGASVITMQFRLDLSLDIAEQEVQAAINAANSLLPTDLPAPPIYAKVNPADAPVIRWASLEKPPAGRGAGHCRAPVQQQDRAGFGVGLVSMSGGQRPAVRIRPMCRRSPRAACRWKRSAARLPTPMPMAKGSFDGPTKSWTIDANDQLSDAPATQLIVAFEWRAGAPVRCGQGGPAPKTRAPPLDERHPAVIIDVQRQPGANVIGRWTHQGRPARSGSAIAGRRAGDVLTDRTAASAPRWRMCSSNWCWPWCWWCW